MRLRLSPLARTDAAPAGRRRVRVVSGPAFSASSRSIARHELARRRARRRCRSSRLACRCGRPGTCGNSTAAPARCARRARRRADWRRRGHARLLEHRELDAVGHAAELGDLLVGAGLLRRRIRSTGTRARRAAVLVLAVERLETFVLVRVAAVARRVDDQQHLAAGTGTATAACRSAAG